MNSAWDFIKGKRKLLLCLAVLLAFALCLVLLLIPQGPPVQAVVVATNHVSGSQRLDVRVRNNSPKEYWVTAQTEILNRGSWQRFAGVDCELVAQAPWQIRMGLPVDELPAKAALTYRVSVPPQIEQWRLKFICCREASKIEKLLNECCGKVGLKYPFGQLSGSSVRSEHVLEFGE
jgi:hypothetical protein